MLSNNYNFKCSLQKWHYIVLFSGKKMSEKHSVIILGAGVAGISAAEKLTSNGFQVQLHVFGHL
jgi:heterodisulfide reductase subunit A-like polyferredoxin